MRRSPMTGCRAAWQQSGLERAALARPATLKTLEPDLCGCVAEQGQESAAWQAEEYGGGDPLALEPGEDPRGPGEGDGTPWVYATPASRALCQFMHEAGLDRSTAIACDLDCIARRSRGDAPLEINPSQQVWQPVLCKVVGEPIK